MVRQELRRHLENERARLERRREHVRERCDHHDRTEREHEHADAEERANPPDASTDHQAASPGQRKSRSCTSERASTIRVSVKLSAEP